MTARSHFVSSFPQRRPVAGTTPDWAGRAVLAFAILAGVALLSLPGARAASATFGWLPLWLAGLPATAALALAAARHRRSG